MKISMLESTYGSEDAHTVKMFNKGHSYDVADTLARRFIREGSAVANSALLNCFVSSDPMQQLFALNKLVGE